MAKATLDNVLSEIKKVSRRTESMDKKLADIDKRLKSIESDMTAVKKFVAIENANFTVTRKPVGGSGKSSFPMAAKSH